MLYVSASAATATMMFRHIQDSAPGSSAGVVRASKAKINPKAVGGTGIRPAAKSVVRFLCMHHLLSARVVHPESMRRTQVDRFSQCHNALRRCDSLEDCVLETLGVGV